MTVQDLIDRLSRLTPEQKQRKVSKWDCDGPADNEITHIEVARGQGAYGGPGNVVRLS